MSNDLGAFETRNTDGEWLEILNPVTGDVIQDDDGKAMRFLLVGKDSPEYRKAQRAGTERRLKSRSKKNRIDADSIEREATEVLAACTKDFENVSLDGDELICTPISTRKIYTDYPWIREQIDDFVDDRGNFIEG